MHDACRNYGHIQRKSYENITKDLQLNSYKRRILKNLIKKAGIPHPAITYKVYDKNV
jgi:hypothetical protein